MREPLRGRRTEALRMAERQLRRVVADHPSVLGDMLQDNDKEKSQRVINAMLTMTKLDIHGLTRAYDGR